MSIDTTRPQIGRIYDYVLGGTYNHEADRRAAEGMIRLMPAYPTWARQNRAFLADVGRRWAAEGRGRVLDLGSGLPTQGHFDTLLPSARVLFTDVEPLTVEQGRELLAAQPDKAYLEIDLRRPDALIERAAAFFGDDRALAVGCIGVLYFLTDDELRSLMARLHAFCAPGSVMALSFPTVPESEEVKATIAAASQHARINFYSRTPDQVAELIAPWRMGSAERLADRFGDGGQVAEPDHPMHRTEVFGAFAAR